MREILFKAKRVDNGEWIEGNLVFLFQTKAHEAFIIPIKFGNAFMQLREGDLGFRYWYKVDPETLCQFTGETDKNGKRIWESDVVWLVCDGKEHIYQIVWDNSELDFKATKGEENYGTNYEYLLCCDEIEVIGNVFDNSELLQEVPE